MCKLNCMYSDVICYSGYPACNNPKLKEMGYVYKELYPIEVTSEIKQRCKRDNWFIRK